MVRSPACPEDDDKGSKREMKLPAGVRHEAPAGGLAAGDQLLPGDPAALRTPADAERHAPADLQLPGPARLVLTACWNLAESLGFPVVAYVAGARLGGQGAGMAAATATIWLSAAVRRGLTGSVP